MNTAELKEFVELEKKKADLKQQQKETQERIDKLDETLTAQFIEDGIQSMRIDGRTVYLRRDIYAGPKGSDSGEDTATKRAPVVAALKECGLGQYVREDYNANSLTAYVREMVHEAEDQARADGRVLEDPATAVPAPLAATLNISTVFSISSRRT